MIEVKEMTADKAHVVADVMSIMYGTITIFGRYKRTRFKRTVLLSNYECK